MNWLDLTRILEGARDPHERPRSAPPESRSVICRGGDEPRILSTHTVADLTHAWLRGTVYARRLGLR